MIDTLSFERKPSSVGGGGGGGEPVVRAPNRAEGRPGGLGVRVDWEVMDKLAFFNETCSNVAKRKEAKEQGGTENGGGGGQGNGEAQPAKKRAKEEK